MSQDYRRGRSVASRSLRSNSNCRATNGMPAGRPGAYAGRMSFRISGLAAQPFAHLYGLDDEALARHNARRYVADTQPGFPCRVTLEDALPGERVLLVHHVHQPAATPFQA